MKVESREVAFLLVPCAAVFLVATPGGRACPRRCTCYVSTEVHCTFRYLTSIPDSIPADVERINLGYNSLVRLTGTDFSGLSRLELLMLHSNGIHTIAGKTFVDLRALQVLKMSYNKIRKVQKDTFYGLRSLTRLHLDHNNIEFINPEAFYGLTLLRLVHLEGNQLSKLHPDVFVSLRYLQIFKTSSIKYLYLSDNFLTSLPQEMVSYMPDLESLYLHGNPWTCDCRLRWLSDWMQEKPDVIKCKKDRSPSSPQQCPLCVNPRISKGKALAVVPAAAFLCAKPAIDPSLKSKNLTIPEDSGPASLSPLDFTAPFGSLTLNMTDESGNEAHMACSIRKPSGTSPLAFTEENNHLVLNVSFSTSLVCNVDHSHIRPVWHILALYGDSPLTLERSHLLTEAPQLHYRYRQLAPKAEAIFTNVEADLRTDPSWLMQGQISLQLNRTATTLSTLQIQYSSDALITVPRAEGRLERHKWTMIATANNTKLEHTVLVGGTIALDCPGQGDPAPHLEWLLADGSKVRAPYVSEDGRILIDKSGRLELQMADSFDTGVYHCISTNYDDADILTYRITVVEPSVEAARENGVGHTAFAGEMLDLACHSTGSPDASISWVLPGNTVLSQSSGGKHILNNGTLRILQVAPKDQGQYCCVAANPSGVEFLVFQVKIKDERPMEHDGETDGSGLEESRPSAHLTTQPPLSAPTGAGVAVEGSGVRKKDNHRGLIQRRRGESVARRFREYRRQLPASARRIDPQRWAALLEKVKKNVVPEKQDSATVRPPPSVTQLRKVPGEEEDSSGMLSPEEELLVPATKAPRVSAKTVTSDSRQTAHSLLTDMIPGTEVSPVRSPKLLQPGKRMDFQQSATVKTTATSTKISPTTSSRMQGTEPSSTAIFPRLPGVTEFPDAEQMHVPSAPPTAGRTMSKDIHTKTLSSNNYKARVVSESVNPTGGHQTSVTAAGETSSSHSYLHLTQELDTSKLFSDPHTAAESWFQVPRNSTTSSPLLRRFGRRRKVWGRGQVISPYRTPVLRRHRFGIMRPTPRGSAKDSTAAFSATEHQVICQSCPPPERLVSATTTLSLPGSSPGTLPEADLARITAGESTTLAQNPSSLSENKPSVDIEKATPTVKYFSAESTQVIPTGPVRISAPTPRSLERNLLANNNRASVSGTREARRHPVMTSPLSGPTSKPSGPTTLPLTRVSRRKVPWHQSFVDNHKQRGVPRNLQTFGLQKGTATRLPKVSPDLPTDDLPPLHFTTLSPSPSGTRHVPSQTRSPGSRPGRTRPSALAFYPIFPTIASKGPNTMNFIPVPTAVPAAAPTAPASAIIYDTPTVGAGAQKAQGKQEPRGSGDEPDISPAQNLSFTVSAALTSALTTAEMPVSPSVSALPPPPQEDTSRILSTTGLHSEILDPRVVTEELPRESSQTSEITVASETSRFSTPHASPTARGRGITHTATLLFLSSGAALVPIPTSLPLTQGTETDRVTYVKVKPPESPGHGPSAQRLAAEVATRPATQPNAEVTTYTSWMHPPTSAGKTSEPQNPQGAPLLWPENQFGHESSSEITEKDKKPVLSMVPMPSLPEATTPASNWHGQKTVKNNGFDRSTDQKITPSKGDSLSRNTLEKPRIVGGKAASYTVPASSDAFLSCEAVGNPRPTIHWTRVSSGLELSQRKQNSRFQVLPNGTLSIRRVTIQDRGPYLCSASNPLGTDYLHVTLSVVSYPPRILERPTKELTVHSGSTVELKCRAEGRPSPAISWILPDQTVLSESSEGKQQALVRSDGTLVIHNLSIYDRGFYRCMASNPAGQDSLLVKLQVITAPPVILEQKRQVIVGTRGESLKLPCTAKGNPQPTVHWVLSDGTEVRPLQFINPKWLLYSNGTLHIRNIASSDRGTYECIATSSTGSERRVVVLTVEEQETIPRIEEASQRWTKVNLGDRLLLNCSATGEPKPKIIWRLPSKAVIDQWHRMGSRIHVYPNGSLFIGSVTEKDGGDYLCVARNRLGDDLTLMHVSLKLKPAKIDRKQHFQKQVLHGKDFQVDCKASGSPVPEISWSLPDGTMINKAMQADDGGHRIKRYTLFDNGTLYFNRVGIAEEGDYTCYAQNTLGKDEMKVQLTVITAAPRIRQGHKANVRVEAGDTAVLDCEVIGEPKPRVFWLLPSGDTISFSSDRYTFHTNGSLSVSTVGRLDSGEYVCVARSPRGDDTKLYKLDVVSKAPLINGLYANRTVVRATAVRHSKKHLDCRAEGTPSPQITWIMPDNIFLPVPYYGSRITVHPNGTLEIRNVRLSDSAHFICVARNEGGESVLVVQLQVLEMLRRPTFRNPFNEKVVAQPGRSAVLNCSADGNPPPEIIWVLPNGTLFAKGPRGSQYGLANNGSLIVYKTTRSNAGKYRCAARNKVGYIEKLIILEMGQKPVILTYALGTVKSVGGESLSLHCVSDGIPKPSIKWTTPSAYVIDRPQVNGKYILYENGTLVIKEATAYDRGNYICKAQNSVGHAEITIPVMIVAYPPRITNRPPRSILTRTGAAFQLRCVALGVPKPEITWEMPQHSLSSNKWGTHGSKLLHPQGTLVIQNPQTSDSGMYKCTAKNRLGSDYAATYVQVI